VLAITYPISLINNPWILGVIASTGIAGKMLYESVRNVLNEPQSIRFLVSRDSQNLSESEINKAAIETYAENLSDGVIAPLFYLLLFGLVGLFVYKAINTLDSMVGYRNDRYERFGKVSARLDDVLNYIPSRITAVIIVILFGKLPSLKKVWLYGAQHESPNAGYPISAMALSLDISLGGPTSYFGKIKEKPYFGEGEREITAGDVQRALTLQWKLDILTILVLTAGVMA
jgi:adenosylcobinamide-phosphate synthase